MNSEIAMKYREFEIPGTAQVVEGNGGCPRYALQHLTSSGRYIFTARTSPPGSHMEGRKYSFSAHSRDGRTATQFAEAYPSVSLGLEARQTIPKRPRTASSARSHGIWNRY